VAVIDLRSDTVTTPGEEMRQAAAEAEVGDDVYGEDPSVNELEAAAADAVGKEAALYVPSGTMGNQIAARVHTERGEEALVERESHVYKWELGGFAQHAELQVRTFDGGANGCPTPEQVREGYVEEDLHRPGTELLTYDSATESLVRRAVDGIETEGTERQERDIDDSPQGSAFLRQETLVYESSDNVDIGPFEVAMYVPIGVHGVLGVGKLDSRSFTESEQKFTEILAEHVRVTLSQVRRENELTFLSDVLSRVLRHNVRNELQPVTAFAEILSDRLSGEEREIARKIQSKASDVVQKSEKARVIEKVMKGQKTRTELDIISYIEQTIELVEDQHPDAEITTTLSEEAVATGLPTIGHSIDELVENAIIHNDSDTPTVDIHVRSDEDGITVKIADNGPGISESEIDIIRRQDEMDLSHGSGVGLYLANWIVERSGGTLEFETGASGTTVTMELSHKNRPGGRI